jgi:predicted nucleotidyltransferase
MNKRLIISREGLEVFCRERGIRWLAVFGSALREDFQAGSDVDVLVEFEPDCIPSLLGIARLERELSSFFNERKVDLRTPEDLSRYFRQEVIQEAEVQYAKG